MENIVRTAFAEKSEEIRKIKGNRDPLTMILRPVNMGAERLELLGTLLQIFLACLHSVELHTARMATYDSSRWLSMKFVQLDRTYAELTDTVLNRIFLLTKKRPHREIDPTVGRSLFDSLMSRGLKAPIWWKALFLSDGDITLEIAQNTVLPGQPVTDIGPIATGWRLPLTNIVSGSEESKHWVHGDS
ncbi:hypothetical protein FACS1894198_3040 [Clostridia bacterium]|nr:hypothetical protein FACS1894198_3040 [Clostridia bacterium]